MASTPETALPLPAATEEERVYIASQWKLIWWRFLRHRLALIGTAVVLVLYMVAAFAEFLTIHDPLAQAATSAFIPPQRIHFFQGKKPVMPYVFGLVGERNPVTLGREWVADESQTFTIRYFVRGYDYKLFGLIPTNWHLIGLDTVLTPAPLHPFWHGQDGKGPVITADDRDQDLHVHRPDLRDAKYIPGDIVGGAVWPARRHYRRDHPASYRVPARDTDDSPLAGAGGCPAPGTGRLSRYSSQFPSSLPWWVGQTSPGRCGAVFWRCVTRIFVIAARLYGTGQIRLIFRHMLPSFTSHVIAATSLSIPGIIVAETSLSFLGVGYPGTLYKLGCSARRGAEPDGRCQGLLAHAPRSLRAGRDPVFQLHGRWTSGRRRPLRRKEDLALTFRKSA